MENSENNNSLRNLGYYGGYRIVIGYKGHPVNRFAYSIFNSKGEDVNLTYETSYSMEAVTEKAIRDLKEITKTDLNLPVIGGNYNH